MSLNQTATDPSAHAPVRVVLDRTAIQRHHDANDHAFGLHCREVLDHLRVAHDSVDSLELPDGPGVVVLAELDSTGAGVGDRLASWVEAGGTLVVTAGVAELAELGGVRAEETELRLVAFDVDAGWTQRAPRPLRALAGHALTPASDAPVEVLARWVPEDGAAGVERTDAPAAITRARRGQGEVVCVGVALWETVVRILQGHPVHEDHPPAEDGSAPMDEGVLKCEDGMALDVDRDRRMPPGEPELTGRYEFGYPPPYAPPIFDLPQADLWVSAFAQVVWAALDRQGAHGWLHYWPAGVPAMAHMSHDSDGNDDADGQAALDAFAEADVAVTWCQVYRDNAYSPEIYDKITEAGHEHALHYNAMEDADIAQWGWEQIKGQYAWAQDIIRTDTKITSNKNHYTRWEGWTEFYGWCEQLGITIDESRGPSKLGTVGFPFGTAHVDFPMGDVSVANRPMDVLNLPLHTQDLCWAGHISCRDVILDQSMAVHGVAHFLYHGPHLRGKPATRASCAELAELARSRGMRWWTARQIDQWERARRGVTVTVSPDGSSVTVDSDATLAEAGLLVSLPGITGDITATADDGTTAPVSRVERHGRDWYELTVDLTPGVRTWQVTAVV